MAGSWAHITGDKGRFNGTRGLDNMGDTFEALEECYGMVWFLAAIGARALGMEPEALVRSAEASYQLGLKASPGITNRAREQAGDWPNLKHYKKGNGDGA